MIDHVAISVININTSGNFYSNSLQALGYKELAKDDLTISYGKFKNISFVISQLGNILEPVGKARGLHIAFNALSIENVLSWYSIALENGGKIITAPKYTDAGLFHALVQDPDGWKLEAVFRKRNS